jgi:hypothetical protein
MKKCLLTLLILLLLSSVAFAGSAATANLTTGVVAQLALPSGVPYVKIYYEDGMAFYIYFKIGGGYEFVSNGNQMLIRLDDTGMKSSPYKAETVPLEMYYVGSESAGVHTKNFTVTANPWKRVIGDDKNVNDIRVSFAGEESAQSHFSILSVPSGDNVLNLTIGVDERTESKDHYKLGVINLSWGDKVLVAGTDYAASIEIKISGE